MPTQDNLQAAFAGESQANRKYLAFAAKAEAEGFPQIARLFRAAAAAETVHALAHLRVMKGVADTKQNLQAAIDGEGYEFKEMYPAFIEIAQEEGNRRAVVFLPQRDDASRRPTTIFTARPWRALNAGKDLSPASIFVCDVCGHTAVGEAPDKCPVCGASSRSSRKWVRRSSQWPFHSFSLPPS